MKEARETNKLGAGQTGLRRMAAHLARLILPYRMISDSRSLERAAALLSEGYGLVVLMNHFSTRDAPQVLSFLARDRVIRQYPFLAPVAYHQYHQYGLLVRVLASWFAIRLAPIVTARSVRKLGDQHKRGSGLTDYLDQASEHLGQGGLLLLAPQGGRQSRLDRPRGRPLGKLLSQTDKDGVNHLVFLFLGLGIEGQQIYDQEIAGFNFGRRYEINVGPSLTQQEMWDLSLDLDRIDEWAFTQMANLVPRSYRATVASSHT